MNQTVVAIDRMAGGTDEMPGGTAEAEPKKTVAANQKAVDELPLNSGTWRIDGVPGLYVRCRAQSKSFFLQRRVHGVLVKQTIGEMSLKAARGAAMKEWTRLKPTPASGRTTFEQAFNAYVAEKDLGAKTREIYQYNLDHYLPDWKARALEDIGRDRAGVRALFYSLAKKHGKATGAQVIRTFSAVYRYARKADLELPESPTVAVDLPEIRARDWALSPDELKAWWETSKVDEHGNQTTRGVKALGPIKRMWWLTCLLTGARRGSIEALQWDDIDWDKKTIIFRVTKGDRPYSVPAPDKLIELLIRYRDSGDVPPSKWVFPSPVKPEHHMIAVRDDKRGVSSAHHMRHTYRTALAELGVASDQARLLMGHSLGGDVSRNYITTSPLLVESLRPIANAMSQKLLGMLGAEV
jgi:integrase